MGSGTVYGYIFTSVEENECSSFKWPPGKDPIFWEKCADALACTTGMPRRSGKFNSQQYMNVMVFLVTIRVMPFADNKIMI